MHMSKLTEGYKYVQLLNIDYALIKLAEGGEV